MGSYDSLLQTVGQGYGQANQNAMQTAMMPTFADKFLSGLRNGEDQAFKQQTTLSNMASNQAYKKSQEDNMLNQRVQALMGGLDKTTFNSPEQRNAYVRALIGLKRSPDEAEAMIPQLGEDGTWSGSTASLNSSKQDRIAGLIETGKIKADADQAHKEAQDELLAAQTDTQRALLEHKVKEAKAKANWAGELFRSRVQLNDRMPVEAFTGAGAAKGAPTGYRWEGSNLVVVPGGPEDKKRMEGDINNDVATKAVVDNLDSTIRQASLVLNHPGLSGNFGLSGKAPNVPGSDSSDALAQLDTLKSKLFRATLDSFKEASKQGNTGIGRVLQSEIPMFINNIAPFEKPQSYGQVKQDIERIIQWGEKARTRILSAAQNRGSENLRGSVDSQVPLPPSVGSPVAGGSFRGTSAQPQRTPTITSQAAYDQLPPGADYLDVQGNPHKKGGQ